MLDIVDNNMLEQMTGLHELPIGAYNIRKNCYHVVTIFSIEISKITKKPYMAVAH